MNLDISGFITNSVIWYKDTINELFVDIAKKEIIIDDASIATFFNTTFTDDRDAADDFCLEPDFLTAGSLLMFFGVEGTGKSFLIQDMTVAATTGTSFWGGRYTFKEPMNVLNIYGDKSRPIHKKRYINRYFRKHDDSKIQFVYSQTLYSDMQKAHINPIHFDLSDKDTLNFIERSIKHNKSKLVIIDNLLSCLLSGDINEGKFVKKFIPKLRYIAIEYKCCIIIIHHSNKMNSKDTRGKALSWEDYQGSKVWGAHADTTFFCYPKQEKDKMYKYEGHFRFGKVGGLWTYENFDYKIFNEFPEVDGEKKHIVRFEFLLPTEDEAEDKLKTAPQLYKILKTISKVPIKSTDLRIQLDIGKSLDISPRTYTRRIDDLKNSGYITSKGHTSTIEYTITQKGLEFLNSNIPEVSNA